MSDTSGWTAAKAIEAERYAEGVRKHKGSWVHVTMVEPEDRDVLDAPADDYPTLMNVRQYLAGESAALHAVYRWRIYGDQNPQWAAGTLVVDQEGVIAVLKSAGEVLNGVPKIRTGDAVKHGSTGETWTVAWADYERGEVAWVGWPNGYAKLSDVTLVEQCTDEEHKELVRRLRTVKGEDGRASVKAEGVLRIYGAEHTLKTWPKFFEAVRVGTKTFEVRQFGDRNFRIGDFLRLVELDPDCLAEKDSAEKFTGREMRVRVTYMTVLSEDGGWYALDGKAFARVQAQAFAVMAIVPDEESP